MRLAQQSGRVGSAVIDLELLITCEQVYRCCRDVRDTGWGWGGVSACTLLWLENFLLLMWKFCLRRMKRTFFFS